MYTIRMEPIAERQAAELPPEALPHFLELRAMLQVAPWGGDPFREDRPDGNMRKLVFGGSWLVTYLVLDDRQEVYIVRITWM